MTTHSHYCPARLGQGVCECVLSIASRGNRYDHDHGSRHCGNSDPCPTSTLKCPCGEEVRAEREAMK